MASGGTAASVTLESKVVVLKVYILCKLCKDKNCQVRELKEISETSRRCKKKVRKMLQKIDDVYTVTFDANRDTVAVVGDVDTETLVNRLRKDSAGGFKNYLWRCTGGLWGAPELSVEDLDATNTCAAAEGEEHDDYSSDWDD